MPAKSLAFNLASGRQVPGWFTLLIAVFLLLGAGNDDLSNRQERLKGLSTTEKEEIRRKQQQFNKLSEGEQQRLRALHAAITSSPDSQRLRAVMLRYHEWLKTIPGEERATLLKLPPVERVEKIKQVMQQQQDARFRELVRTSIEASDVRAIFNWVDGYVERHESELMGTLPKEFSARIRNVDAAPMRRKMLLMALGRRREGTQLPSPDEADLVRLEGELSSTARAALAKVSDRDQKMLLVQEWVKAAVVSRFVPQVSNERLLAFYRENRKRLQQQDPKKVEKIDSLPEEMFYAELKKLYFEKQGRSRWEGGGGMHSRGGRPWFRGPHEKDRPEGRPPHGRDDHRGGPDHPPHIGPQGSPPRVGPGGERGPGLRRPGRPPNQPSARD